ncbi:MAG: hypothetical protein F6K24_09420 [Okeania sp. SIO2D1]|nr:hypothetical protein [Okeania sp. SIO2D1]
MHKQLRNSELGNKEEGRRQKAEGRRQKAEGKIADSNPKQFSAPPLTKK